MPRRFLEMGFLFYIRAIYQCIAVYLRRRGGTAPASNVCELGSITRQPLVGKFETGHAGRQRKSSLSLPICEMTPKSLFWAGPSVYQGLRKMIDLLKTALSICQLQLELEGKFETPFR